eukprot:2434193-Prorocentrum_lima.AAC.1
MEMLWQQIRACRMIVLSGFVKYEEVDKWKAFCAVPKMWKEQANANTMPPLSASIAQFHFAMN